jgi:hypothetical protein
LLEEAFDSSDEVFSLCWNLLFFFKFDLNLDSHLVLSSFNL